MGFLRWIWDGLRQLIGLILPIFSKAADFRSYSSGAKIALHVLVLVVVLAGLTFLQNWVLLSFTLAFPNHPYLKWMWLPVLFLLVYVLVWLLWWLWHILLSEEAGSDFPDLDAAWGEISKALQAANIALQDVPLYLVLGRPAAGEAALFHAARLPFLVKQAPGPDAPVQAWANRQDGIYVACVDSSRLGSRASLLALTGAEDSGGAAAPLEFDAATATIGGATIGAGMQVNVGGLLDEQLPEGERRRRAKALDVADQPELARRLTARLEHLCRLVARERWPEPPVNGILVLIPHVATQSRAAAEGTTRDCQQDLESVWNVFRLSCPLFALVCDLEKAPGFADFLEGHLARCRTEEERRKERRRRLGRRLGWGVGMDPATRRSAIEEQVGWIGRGMFPHQIYKSVFYTERPGREDPAEIIRHNYQVSRFFNAMFQGQRWLTAIVRDGLIIRQDGPELLGGCYLAATGQDADREQAFVAGVFERLQESLRLIRWSDEAFQEDAQYQQWTRLGYLGLPVFVLVVAVLLILWWQPFGG